MKTDFRTFERFDKEHTANQMAELLTAHGIPFELEDTSALSDVIFGSSDISKSYSVKLKQEDFERAHRLVEHDADVEINRVDPGHYLFSFTDAELREVVITRDEWSPFDVMLAQKILKERGLELNENEIQQIKAQRLHDLSQPDKDQKLYIFMGYLFALLGGGLALIIGWHLSSHKKTLPNGEQVYGYSDSNRRSGKKILLLGFISSLAWGFCVSYMKR